MYTFFATGASIQRCSGTFTTSTGTRHFVVRAYLLHLEFLHGTPIDCAVLPAPHVPVGPETALHMPPTVAYDSNRMSSGHTRVADPATARRTQHPAPQFTSASPLHMCPESADERLQVLRPDTEMCAVALLPPLGHAYCIMSWARLPPLSTQEILEKRGEASTAGSSARSGGDLAVLSAELHVQGYMAVHSPSGFAVRAIARSRACLVFRTGSNWGRNSRCDVVEFFHGARSTRQTYQRERMESVAARTWHLYRRGDKNGRTDASNMEAGFRTSVSTALRCGKLRWASPPLCGRIWTQRELGVRQTMVWLQRKYTSANISRLTGVADTDAHRSMIWWSFASSAGSHRCHASPHHTLASSSPLLSDVVRPHRLQARNLSKGVEKSQVAQVDSYHDRERPVVWMGHHVEMIMTSLEISRTQLDPMKMTVARLQMVIALWLAREEMTRLEMAIERDTSSIVESLEQLAAIRDPPLDP
ncbi:hypothetical protein BKA93DRAFT_838139 [Sparassis latifolia]